MARRDARDGKADTRRPERRSRSNAIASKNLAALETTLGSENTISYQLIQRLSPFYSMSQSFINARRQTKSQQGIKEE
jgi:hypothetical protein